MAARARVAAEREGTTFAERVARGLALGGLVVEETDAAPGGRIRLWARVPPDVDLDDLELRAGSPVCLWRSAPSAGVRAVLSRRARGRVALVVDGDATDEIFEGELRLDREAPEVTFDRGEEALRRWARVRSSDPLGPLREVLFGDAEPRFEAPADLAPRDADLNDAQRAAVAHALSAQTVALVHGPPGTGKTRTLVEVVLQAVARGERVLVTAASNTAVDNLAERLAEAGAPLLRVGHPARVADALEAHTLDAVLEASEAWALSRKWTREADALRRRATRRAGLGRDERRALFAEARRLMADARRQLAGAQAVALERARVVCATASGAASRALAGESFDRVVLDEATQAVDPIALVALARAPRCVLAGDHRQLPPTVIDEDAARGGLGTTFFERLIERAPAAGRRLQVQHRMHEAIMRFPSEQMYEGSLVAAPAVASHRLEDLGARTDPLRPGPWHFIDTAGKGWEEERAADDASTRNRGQAERVAAEVRRLLRRGVAPAGVAVITPYEAQARLLRRLLGDAREAGLEIGTVDGFQGREKDAIVVDLVRSNERGEIGFLADVRRMNVALTRARRFLLVVGDGAMLGGHPFYAAFVAAAQAQGAWLSAWADDPDDELP